MLLRSTTFILQTLKQPCSYIHKAAMTTQHAIISKPSGAVFRTDVPLPKLRDDFILVKPAYVALNPTDWKSVKMERAPGSVVGCDYAGVVEEVGKAVTKSLKKGDKVAGFVSGSTSTIIISHDV